MMNYHLGNNFRYFNSTGCLFVGESGYADFDNGWSLYSPGVTKESGIPQRRNGTGPLDIPFCDFGTRGRVTAAPWKLCRDGTATVYNIFGTNESLWDWSPDSARNPGAQDNRNFASRIWNLGGSKVFQTEIWKLAAALGCEGSYLQVGSKVRHGHLWNLTMRYPRACVPHPYALLVGSVKIQPGLQNYNVTCNNCTLTNCVRGITNQTRVLVLRQPAFVMVPVKINGSWYDERGLELWREVEGALMRYRRGIGLIILGFVALVTLIASSITAALSLAQSVQTATFVNNLAQNASVALGTQEDIDKKLEDRLNALYDVVKYLGEEVQSIKLRLRVQCHADFRWICVTPKKYNGSITAWDKVKAHLEGIWHNENISLDLLHLHQEIMNIENVPRPDLDVAKRAESFVKELFRHVPTVNSIWYLGAAMGGLFLIILTVLFLAPCLIKKLIDDLWIIKASIYGNGLRLKEHKRVPI